MRVIFQNIMSLRLPGTFGPGPGVIILSEKSLLVKTKNEIYNVYTKDDKPLNIFVGKYQEKMTIPEDIRISISIMKTMEKVDGKDICKNGDVELIFFSSKESSLENFLKKIEKTMNKKEEIYERILTLNGLGLKAFSNKNTELELSLGKAHKIGVKIPKGVKAEVMKESFAIQGAGENQRIVLSGNEIQMVHNLADAIVKLLPPEPYKGKGVIIRTERNMEKWRIFRKEGKKNKS